MPQVIELERKCGQRGDDGALKPKPITSIYDGINDALATDPDGKTVWIGGGAIHPMECNEVLRLGLIGGNNGQAHGEVEGQVGPIRAAQLVQDYGYPARPLVEVAAHALRILHAAIVGIEVKKKPEVTPTKARGAAVKSSRKPSIKAAS
jgi:hypothetical protein